MQHVEREGPRRRRAEQRERGCGERASERSGIGAVLPCDAAGTAPQHASRAAHADGKARHRPDATLDASRRPVASAIDRGRRLTLRSHRVAPILPPQVPDDPAADQLPDARRRGAAASLHRRRRAARRPARSSSSAARASGSSTSPGAATSTASPASGAAASASATPSSSRRRACRWRSSPTTTSSPAAATSPASSSPRRSRSSPPAAWRGSSTSRAAPRRTTPRSSSPGTCNNALGRPAKKKIISRVKGYHGVTIVAASLTGLPNNHRDFDLPIDVVRHTATPHFWKGAEDGESERDFSRPPRRRARGPDRRPKAPTPSPPSSPSR